MPAFLKKKKEQEKKRKHSVISPSLWLFYLGLLSMSLTGVTFSKYSTVVRGTISVKVAAAVNAVFLDDTGEELAALQVYEGQSISESDVPAVDDSVTTGNNGVSLMALDEGAVENTGEEVLVYKKFLGWTLDGETIVDPTTVEVVGDLYFYAVYDITVETVVKPTPSDAAKAPAVPSTGTQSSVVDPTAQQPDTGVAGTNTVPETSASAGTETGAAGTNTVPETGAAGTETVPETSAPAETETLPETGAAGNGTVPETETSAETGTSSGTEASTETAAGSENVYIPSSSNATKKIQQQ